MSVFFFFSKSPSYAISFHEFSLSYESNGTRVAGLLIFLSFDLSFPFFPVLFLRCSPSFSSVQVFGFSVSSLVGSREDKVLCLFRLPFAPSRPFSSVLGVSLFLTDALKDLRSLIVESAF